MSAKTLMAAALAALTAAPLVAAGTRIVLDDVASSPFRTRH